MDRLIRDVGTSLASFSWPPLETASIGKGYLLTHQDLHYYRDGFRPVWNVGNEDYDFTVPRKRCFRVSRRAQQAVAWLHLAASQLPIKPFDLLPRERQWMEQQEYITRKISKMLGVSRRDLDAMPVTTPHA